MKSYKYIQKSLFFGLFLLLNASLYAQAENRLRVFVSNNFLDNKSQSVFVKWIIPGAINAEGVNLFRRINGSEWQKLNNDAPIKIMTEPLKSVALDDQFNAFYKTFRDEDISKLENANYLIVLSLTGIIYDLDFALSMGSAFIDSEINFGDRVQYKVEIIGKDVFYESEEYVSKPFEKQAPPQDIVFERKKKEIALGWKPEVNRLFATFVYRYAIENEEPYLVFDAPINLQPNKNGEFETYHVADKNIHKDSTYYYIFEGIDHFGQITKTSKPVKVSAKDFEPPFAAFGMQSSQKELVNQINWEALEQDDLAGFNILRGKQSDSLTIVNNKLLPDTARQYLDQMQEPGDYFYRIQTVDTAGNTMESSLFISNIVDVMPPQAPVGFAVIPDSGKFIFTWEANKEEDVVGYYIYKSPIGSSDYVVLNPKPIEANGYEEKMPANIKNKFKYALVAVDTAKNRSELSDSVIVKLPDVTPPQIPGSVKVENRENGVNISWVKSIDADVKFYGVSRFYVNEDGDTVNETLNATIGRKDSVLLDFNPVKNRLAFYQVYAVDSSGNQSQFTAPYGILYKQESLPVSILSFETQYKRKKAEAQLAWEIGNLENVYAATLYRGKSEAELEQYSGSLKNKFTFIDTKLASGETYFYQLVVFDKKGNKIKSEIKNIQIP